MPEPGQAAEPGRNHKGQAGPDADPEQNHTTSKREAEQDTEAQAAGQENTGRPADTSNDSAASDAPPRTRHRTGQP